MKVAAVVLAAGASKRLGRPKQRLKHDGKTLLLRAVEAAQGGGCDRVIVVVGHAAEAVAAGLGNAETEIVRNDDWAEGVAGSIRSGVAHAASGEADAVLILTCDQPHLDASLVRRMIDELRRDPQAIVAAEYAGIRGVPTAFPRSDFDALGRLAGDRGARAVIDAAAERVIGVAWPEGAVDIDTRADWRRFRAGDPDGL